MSGKTSDSRLGDITDVLRGALAALLGFVLRTGARLAFLLIAGNLYGKELLGALGYAAAVVETIAALSVFGFKRSLFPLLDEAGGSRVREGRQVLASALVFSLGLALIGALILYSLWDKLDLPGGSSVALFAWVIPLIVLSDVLLSATRYQRVMKYEVMSRSVAEPWVLSLVALALYLGKATEYGLFAAYFCGLLAAASVAIFGFARTYPATKIWSAGPSRQAFRRILGFSSPTAVVDVIALAFRRIDIFFLWHFTSDGVVGIYVAAQQIASHVQKTRHLFDPILAPVISRTMSHKGLTEAAEQISQISRWVFTIMLLQVLLLSAYGDLVLGLIGPGMAAGALILVVLIVAETIEGTLASAELPIIFRRPRFNLWLSLVAAAAHLTFCAILVPRFGGMGAAASLLISLTLINLMRIGVAGRMFGIYVIHGRFLKPAVAAGAAAGVMSLLTLVAPAHAGWRVAAGAVLIIVAYAGTLWLLGLSKEDRELLAYLKGNKTAS